MSPLRRLLVPAAGGLAVAGVLGWLGWRFFTDPTVLPPDDFVAFWGAGRVAVTGGNPYDDAQLLPVQTAAGWDRAYANILWGPPWTLAAYMPFGALPARPAQLVWLLLQLFAVCGVAAVAFRRAGGAGRLAPLAPVAVLTFAPTMFLVTAGQNSGWCVLGVGGLLVALTGGPGWPAALGALAALKPHLFGPLWVVFALDAARRRRTIVALGWGVAAGLFLIAASAVVLPDAWTQYRELLRQPPSPTRVTLADWQPPLVAYHLRMLVAPDRLGVQFVPAAVAGVWAAARWWRRRDRWDWAAELPLLVLVGLIAAPYSAWPFDLVLLVFPLADAAARLAAGGTRRQVAVAGAAYLLLNVAAGLTREAADLLWPAPACMAGWLLVRRAAVRPTGFPQPG